MNVRWIINSNFIQWIFGRMNFLNILYIFLDLIIKNYYVEFCYIYDYDLLLIELFINNEDL